MPRIDIPLRGFLVPLKEWTHTNMSIAKDDPSEGGPQPGSGEAGGASDLRLVASGAQDEDIDIEVISAGYPGRGSGPAVVARNATSTDFRAWSPPYIAQYTSGIGTWNTATSASPSSLVLEPQAIRLPGTTTFGVSHDGKFHVYDFDSASWSTAQVAPSLGTNRRGCDATAVGSRLFYAAAYTAGASGITNRVDIWYSDDLGSTWSVYAEDVTQGTVPASVDAISLEYHQQTGTIALYLDTELWASADLGQSFSLVSVIGFSSAKSTFLSDGTILQAVVQTDQWLVSRTTTPFDPPERSNSLSETNVWVGVTSVSLWADEDDTVYAMVETPTSAVVFVSYDLGFTWEQNAIGSLASMSSITGTHTRRGVVSCRGSQILPLAASVGNSDSANEVGVYAVHFGEWSELQVPYSEYQAGLLAVLYDAWLPPMVFDSSVTPSANSWESNYYVIDSTTPAAETWPDGTASAFTPSSSPKNVSVYWDLQPLTGTTSGSGRSIDLVASDGAVNYDIRCRITSAGISVYDNKAAAYVGATGVFGGYSRVQVWLSIDVVAGTVAVYYREINISVSRVWKAGPTGSLTSSAGVVNTVRVGHNGLQTLRTRSFAISMTADGRPIFGGPWAHGKRLGPSPYPLDLTPVGPASGANDGVYMSAVAGPGLLGDDVLVPVEYDYGARNLLAVDSPSHTRPWRSGNDTIPDRDIIISVGERKLLGRSLAVLLRRSTVVSLTLAGRKGGGAWTTIATMDPSITYTYRTNGATLYPNASNPGLRYIRENELAGAWIEMGTSARRIESNTAGSLSDGTGRQCLITIADATGTELASGTAVIHPHTSCMVYRSSSLQDWDEWRVRINGQAVAPDAYWEVGALLVGAYQPIGLQPSHGWSHRKDPQVRQVRDSRGVAYRAQTGETQTVWSWSYQDPHDERQYLTYADDPPWIGGEGGPSDYLATYQDVSSLLWGVLDRMEGGALPCAVIAYDTSDLDGAVTISDPELFLYSYITSSIQRNNVLGAEGEDAVYRVESITAEEILG